MPKKTTKTKNIAVTGKKQGYWVNEENLRKGERTIEIKKDKLKKDKHLVRRYRSGYDYNQIFIGYELTKEDLKQQFAGRKQANPRAAQYDLAIRAKNTQEAPIITAKQFFDFTRADIEGIDTPKTKNEVEFEERVQKLAREIGVQYKDIEWKKMKNIWGQATSTKQLRFNPEVLTKDQKFQDKVIIHELLHLRYPGHSVMQRRMEKTYLNELYPATKAVDRSKSIAAGKNLYLEKYDPKKTNLAKTKTMTDMQKRRLIKMCKDNGIDTRELDSSLKYDENQEIINHMIELNEENMRDERSKVEQKIQDLEANYLGGFSQKRIKERAIDSKTTEQQVITKEDLIRKRKKKKLEEWEDEPYISKIDVENIDTAKD